MPWSNQSGGGGPWKPSNQGGGGPWGQGSGGGGSGGGGQPPDLEDLFRRSQDKLKDLLPGGGPGSISAKGIVFIGLLFAFVWSLTGLYTVRPDEVGVNLVFGRFTGLSQPGLNYNPPYPIGQVIKPRVTAVNTMEIGVRQEGVRRAGRSVVAEESLMLTGDENIVDIDFNVQWQINPARPQDYVFNLQNPENAVKAVAESAMREVIGRRNITTVLTTDRQAIETEVLASMQKTLDDYKAGVVIRLVQLLKADPPTQVIDSFRDVQAARQDQDRLKNEAETYASRVVPEARGQAAQIVQAAEAYRSRTVAEARGAADRFSQVVEEYRKAPEVTRQRMFLETMERIFGGMDKIILDQNGGSAGSVVPYLPLNELQQRRPGGAGPGPAQPLPGAAVSRAQGAAQ